MSILNVAEKIRFDNSLVSIEKHSHLPYAATSFEHNDEIRIPIQQTDVYTLPSSSCIYIEGTFLKEADNQPSATAKLSNNFVCHLFEEFRYEIGGKIIDRVRNPGITTTLKGYASFNVNKSNKFYNAGWNVNDEQRGR